MIYHYDARGRGEDRGLATLYLHRGRDGQSGGKQTNYDCNILYYMIL